MTGAELQDRLTAEGLAGRLGASVQSWANGPGDRYGEHAHDYDKVLLVEGGSITFGLATGAVELEAGDRLDLPAGSSHGAVVGAEGVRCLEAHLERGSLPSAARHEGWAKPQSARGS